MNRFEIDVVAAIIHNSQNKFLITKRPEGFHLAGLWEFPGGKVEDGEEQKIALAREIKEETDLDIKVGKLFWTETAEYSMKRVKLYFYDCYLTEENQEVKCLEIDDFRWITKSELNQYKFPEADDKLIKHLVK
ncbi:MAG: 8-oxo-dGTP diphosphatase MutT [Calditrichaeota bacterium]|nr:MAG: 8-oxo-dGTP diphosphatase MutT [Calditrichota bacterium]MBL1206000.1 8-oxo-dGTP diphosphatase MutT [Calditrichota bacterium]NOG45828.1 8-oxo-dGTP diphosphatase MutT [Calditrichota bacterium]